MDLEPEMQRMRIAEPNQWHLFTDMCRVEKAEMSSGRGAMVTTTNVDTRVLLLGAILSIIQTPGSYQLLRMP